MRNRPLLVIFLTILIDLIGIGILIPVMPQLLANPDSPHYLLPAGYGPEHGYLLLGLLTAVYPLMMFFSAPILGQLSDRHGRRKVLAFCLAGTSFGYALFALGVIFRSLPLLFLSRIIDGATGGNISVAQAAVADVSKPEDRSKNFGLIGMAFGLGFIMGPFLGGKLADPSSVSWFDAATPFWFAAILAAVNFVSVLLFFPETRAANPAAAAFRWLGSFLHLGEAWRMRELRALLGVQFLFTIGFGFFISFFSVFLVERFAFSEGQIGNYFAFVGVCIALAQGLVVRAFAGKFKEAAILRVTIMGTAICLMAYLIPRDWRGLVAIVPFMASMNGLNMANLGALISRTAKPEEQGKIMGISASLNALGATMPPLLSGAVAAALSPSATLAVASGIIACAWLVFVRTHRGA